MQLCARAQRIARVLHEPWFASEAGSAPTIELRLDSKFHAPISSGLTKHNSGQDARSALFAGPRRSSAGTPLATSTCYGNIALGEARGPRTIISRPEQDDYTECPYAVGATPVGAVETVRAGSLGDPA